MRPVVNHCAEHPFVFSRKIHTPGTSELISELEADVSNCGSIDQRSKFLNVIDEDTVIKRLVSIVSILQINSFCDVVWLCSKSLHNSIYLRLEVSGRWRKKSPETQPISLSVVKCCTFVPQGIMQNIYR